MFTFRIVYYPLSTHHLNHIGGGVFLNIVQYVTYSTRSARSIADLIAKNRLAPLYAFSPFAITAVLLALFGNKLFPVDIFSH